MKRIILPLFCAVILLSSCGKKDKVENLNEKITKVAELYFANDGIDSLRVQSIDTLSSLGYVNLMLEMLENMKFEIEYQYKDAIFTDNEALINEIESDMMDIDYALDRYREYAGSESVRIDDLVLYIASVSVYKGGEESPTMLLFTPEFTMHILDPFDDNVLENREVAQQ